MPLVSGTRLGPYEVTEPLGAGGMGEVYRARDTRLEREVALKVLPGRSGDDAAARERFRREARLASALAHPNVCSVFDVGSEGTTDYLVIEYVEGRTLRDRLTEGALPPAEALAVAAQLARGLAAAHARGIVHRDLKPENVMVGPDGHVKILDFGLARRAPLGDASASSAETVAGATEPGTVLGTVGYMSPEQVQGLTAGAAADVFAFGAIAVEMLTGRRAFAGSSPGVVIAAILRDPAEISPAVREAAPELVRIAERCLEKSPEARYTDARELVAALSAIDSRAPQPRPVSGPSPRPRAPQGPVSIAVLAFDDLSPARDQDYFCEGIADEILTALGRLPGFRVASRGAAFQLRGPAVDPKVVGERLGVDVYLEGSVRRAGERLRVAVRLLGTRDGYQLWSERYDRRLSDVFEIQEEIASAIASALRVVLTDRERDLLLRGHTSSLEAFDYYLRGRQFFSRPVSRNVMVALDLFEKAVALDPSFAGAWAHVSICSTWCYTWFGSHPRHLARAEEASLQAVSLAPALADARAARGLALALSRSFEEADREFEEATRLDPYLFEAHYFRARMCISRGRLEEAARHFDRAAELRPDDYQAPLLSVSVYRTLDRPDDVQRCLRTGLLLAERQLDQHPEDTRALYLGAGALAQLGRREKATEWLERALALDPEEPSVLYNGACVLVALGDHARALDCLERSMRGGFGYRDWMRNDSDLDPLREHPRFKAMLGGEA